MTGRQLEVLTPGPLTTVQDLGRPGLSAWGVGRSGAADRGSAALANRLVANPSDAAVLEVTLGGLSLRAASALTVALTGAPAPADVDGSSVAFGAPIALAAGAVLRLGVPPTGLRTYLAVRGGIDVPPVLGSRSYDVLARLGPPPLRTDDVLDVGPEPRAWPKVDHAPASSRAAGAVVLTGAAGPHANALDADSESRLGSLQWSVSSASDRSGVRLEGAQLRRRDDAQWPPEGLVRGALQLPPSGRPIVMLADHPVTGGYPVIAALDQASCDLAAQLRPGQLVRLQLSVAQHRVPARPASIRPA